MKANDTQIGGDHYKNKGECPHCGTPLEHWDIAWAFQFNMFQYIISKWIFRRKGPEGRHLLDDLKKIIHATEKYMEVVRGSEDTAAGYGPDVNMAHSKLDESGIPTGAYVNQD